MSRIGNKPVDIPDKVKVNIDNDGGVSVEGPKGKLNWKLPRQITGSVEDNHVSIARGAETRSVKALHGLSRALVHNMVVGVSECFAGSGRKFLARRRGRVCRSTFRASTCTRR